MEVKKYYKPLGANNVAAQHVYDRIINFPLCSFDEIDLLFSEICSGKK